MIRQSGHRDGDAAESLFAGPVGIRLSGHYPYVADTSNHAIRRIDLTAAPSKRRAAR